MGERRAVCGPREQCRVSLLPNADPPIDRYHRQRLLPFVGDGGQRRLAASHVLVVGVGALGCVSADLLARAGVGRLTLVDRDLVEPTNLQRQSLYDEADAAGAVPKAVAAAGRLGGVNGEIEIEAVVADATGANVERLAGLAGGERPAADVMVDGTDNFETRYLLNDVAVKHGVPFVYGGAVASRGMAMTVLPRPVAGLAGASACLRCLFERPPAAGSEPTCDTAGVWGPVAAIVGAVQAAEAMKLLLGRRDAIAPTLLEFDLWEGRRRRLEIAGARRADCPCCGRGGYEFLDRPAGGAARLCGRDAWQVGPPPGAAPQLGAVAGRLAPHGEVQQTPLLVRAILRGERGVLGEAVGLTVFHNGRVLVSRARDEAHARSVVARYVGV